MFFDLLIKRASRDAETLGSLLHSASLFLKNPLDMLLFEFLQSQTCVEVRRADLCVAVEVKIVKCDRFLIAEQDRTFDYVTKFANVAGPRVSLQRLNAALVQPRFSSAQVCRNLTQEILGQRGNVFDSLTQ